MKKAIVCTLDSRAEAEAIIRRLTAVGFGTNGMPEGAIGGAATVGVLGGTR